MAQWLSQLFGMQQVSRKDVHLDISSLTYTQKNISSVFWGAYSGILSNIQDSQEYLGHVYFQKYFRIFETTILRILSLPLPCKKTDFLNNKRCEGEISSSPAEIDPSQCRPHPAQGRQLQTGARHSAQESYRFC